MQQPDITTIAARAAAATRGPWELDEGGGIEASGSLIGEVYGADDFPCLDDDERTVVGAECKANAIFITSAREDVPALLAYIKHLELQRDTFVRQVTELRAAQRRYFSSRTAKALQVAMAAERIVDIALDGLPIPRSPQTSMEVSK